MYIAILSPNMFSLLRSSTMMIIRAVPWVFLCPIRKKKTAVLAVGHPQIAIEPILAVERRDMWPSMTGWWLSPTPLKNDVCSSVGMMTFPTEWENKTYSKAPTR